MPLPYKPPCFLDGNLSAYEYGLMSKRQRATREKQLNAYYAARDAEYQQTPEYAERQRTREIATLTSGIQHCANRIADLKRLGTGPRGIRVAYARAIATEEEHSARLTARLSELEST